MERKNINPENCVFVMLSFEGPDPYSSSGGLGVRATNLTQTLAEMGYLTHLFFVGDPRLKGEEGNRGGRLVLHRWCQWISEYYPGGVYQGEYDKLNDFTNSIPGFAIENIIEPALRQDKFVVILAEEWHTTKAVCRIHDLLLSNSLRDKVVMFWNANNTYGFEQVDWHKLKEAATITTVSRYMKHLMWQLELNPLVIPNGIPRNLLRRINDQEVAEFRKAIDVDVVLCKVARWHSDKRWNEAVEATARLKEEGLDTVLIARGGSEPYGDYVVENAKSLGLKVREAEKNNGASDGYLAALSEASSADVIDVKFNLPPEFLRIMYRAADGVLANSSHEPFGLVGLETMAAGGVTYTGGTGEDYAIPFVNSFVLETANPMEIVDYITYLRDSPQYNEKMRKAARHTAREFTWETAVANLMEKLKNQARAQNILAGRAQPPTLPLLETEEGQPEASDIEQGFLTVV